ncbi:hypothetical protein K438DRAFT_1759473 [Mycena galopus ATCC 62051]|nr:hypothetical protein K438DRAFT_1759473 [Mycena galopus ATCC 62051]
MHYKTRSTQLASYKLQGQMASAGGIPSELGIVDASGTQQEGVWEKGELGQASGAVHNMLEGQRTLRSIFAPTSLDEETWVRILKEPMFARRERQMWRGRGGMAVVEKTEVSMFTQYTMPGLDGMSFKDPKHVSYTV